MCHVWLFVGAHGLPMGFCLLTNGDLWALMSDVK